jgi:eukaryotic-like serine/threonine-protein kinase
VKDADELTRRAMDSARRNDAHEIAAAYQAQAALRAVAGGNREQAHGEAEAAVKLAPNRDVRGLAAIVLARAGDTASPEKLADELDKDFPQDTLAQRSYLPTIRAAVALQHKDPNQAIDLLKVASAIELGRGTGLYAAYVRGDAYLCCMTGRQRRRNFRSLSSTRDSWVTILWPRWRVLV